MSLSRDALVQTEASEADGVSVQPRLLPEKEQGHQWAGYRR